VDEERIGDGKGRRQQQGTRAAAATEDVGNGDGGYGGRGR
jgi:hypothetical protein